MAILNSDEGYVLHIKGTDNVYDCALYTTTDEATPITNNAGTGKCWKLTRSGVTCYVGLWPAEATNTPPKDSADTSELSVITPLTIKRDDVEYKVLRYVLNTAEITLKATENQTYEFTYYDIDNVQQSVTVSDADVSVTALCGTQYTCAVTAAQHYLSGTPSCGASGYISADMTVSLTDATNNLFVLTITVPENAVLTIGGTEYTEGTATTSYDGGDKISISAATTDAVKYVISDITINDVEFTGEEFTMPASATTITCEVSIHKYVVTLEQAAGTVLTVTANGVDVSSGYAYDYGTTLEYSVEDADAEDAYENPEVEATNVE